MSVDMPATIWRQTSGNGEFGRSDSANITTLNGAFITTLSGIELVIDPGSYTPLAATEWHEDDSV